MFALSKKILQNSKILNIHIVTEFCFKLVIDIAFNNGKYKNKSK